MNSPIRPIFIFSLPRAGSTLLQRVIATHSGISTASEPWILLPQFYALRQEGFQAEYGHVTAARALEDFCAILPRTRQGYLDEVREFALRLYRKAAEPRAQYFLDKTPRYHLVVEEIIPLFPDGRFVFLWRNPLAVVASIVETWGGLKRFEIDLYTGLTNLVSAAQRFDDQVLALRYEDLLSEPERELDRISTYLGLELGGKAISEFAEVSLGGRMGDKTGRFKYRALSTEPLHKYRVALSNPLLKNWCHGYIKWIGEARLSTMGYSLSELEAELAGIHPDVVRLCRDMARGIRRRVRRKAARIVRPRPKGA